MKERLDIAVAIPSTEMWEAQFGLSLTIMAAYFGMNRLTQTKSQYLHVINSRGSMLPQLRENLVSSAMRTKSSHILFLDSDMTFPKDTMHRLIEHDKDFVAANCAVKKIPSYPTALGLDNMPIYTDPDSTGLVKVRKVGLAVALVKTTVFNKIPQPWFLMDWDKSTRHYIGEDVYFCRKARKLGISLHVDQDLSKEIGHVGAFKYTHDLMVEELRKDAVHV